MKKSLNYLPPDKRRDLRQLVSIIREEVRGCVMVILYGSYARGTFVDYDQRIEYGVPTYFMSDYDILIVTERRIGTGSESSLYAKILRRFYENKNWKFHTRPQLINASIGELNRELEKGRYFYTDIKKEGVMLWDSGGYTLARRRKLNYAEIAQMAGEYFEEKFSFANDLLIDAKFDYSREKYKLCSFHLHQAAENFLRTIPMVFILYGYKDHDLEALLNYAKTYTLEVCDVFPRDTEEERRLFSLLQAAYVQARYNRNFAVSREDIDALLPRIERLREVTEKVCRERIRFYREKACAKG